MAAIWESVTEAYNDAIRSGDPRVASWFLVETPVPTLIIVGLYMAFVKVIGPAWMKNRKPFDLKSAMFIYNMALVFTNFYLVIETCKELLRTGRGFKCQVENVDDPIPLGLYEMGYWYFILKFVELADTVFFVFRKKFLQISHLHVFHHSSLPVISWIILRTEPGNYNFFAPLLNTVVHILMYIYYGLAALGPKAKKYLWWKKYLTVIQMAQFVLVFIYIISMELWNCGVSTFGLYSQTLFSCTFFVMFYRFYQRTYIKKKESRKQ